jgi:hypothetical protein
MGHEIESRQGICSVVAFMRRKRLNPGFGLITDKLRARRLIRYHYIDHAARAIR